MYPIHIEKNSLYSLIRKRYFGLPFAIALIAAIFITTAAILNKRGTWKALSTNPITIGATFGAAFALSVIRSVLQRQKSIRQLQGKYGFSKEVATYVWDLSPLRSERLLSNVGYKVNHEPGKGEQIYLQKVGPVNPLPLMRALIVEKDIHPDLNVRSDHYGISCKTLLQGISSPYVYDLYPEETQKIIISLVEKGANPNGKVTSMIHDDTSPLSEIAQSQADNREETFAYLKEHGVKIGKARIDLLVYKLFSKLNSNQYYSLVFLKQEDELKQALFQESVSKHEVNKTMSLISHLIGLGAEYNSHGYEQVRDLFYFANYVPPTEEIPSFKSVLIDAIIKGEDKKQKRHEVVVLLSERVLPVVGDIIFEYTRALPPPIEEVLALRHSK